MEIETILFSVGLGLIGVCFGYLLGLFTKKWTNPRVSELQRALETNEDYHKTQMSRLKRRIAEYEQPPELQQMASALSGTDLSSPDAVSMLLSNIGGIKGVPKWIRPFLPAIQGYIKENPQQVQELLQKFLNTHKGAQQEGEYL